MEPGALFAEMDLTNQQLMLLVEIWGIPMAVWYYLLLLLLEGALDLFGWTVLVVMGMKLVCQLAQ